MSTTSRASEQVQVLVFTDESNRAWEVREIREAILPARSGLLLRQEYSSGWLLFISGDERRRLAPYPPGWRLADPVRLRCWVNDALPVRTTSGAEMVGEVCDLPTVDTGPQRTI
jgi:hypothetical protein